MSVGRPMCGESTARTIVAVRLVSRGLPGPVANGGSEVVVSTRTQPAAAHRRDSLRALRILWRSPLVLLHVLVALPLMGLVVNSLGARITVGGLRWDHRAIRWWSARAARLFGIRIKVLGTPLPGGVLFVAKDRKSTRLNSSH